MNNDDLLVVFAAHAMQELLRDDLARPVDKQMGYEWVSKYSYVIADEMMKARDEHYTTKTA